MWQQKQNNFIELDELVGLPEETTADKTALWQRLESRLQKKPQQKKVVWYWAAACLLICITVPFLFNSNKNKIHEAGVVNNNSTIKEPTQTQKTVATENIQLCTDEIKPQPVVSNVPSPHKKMKVSRTKRDSLVFTAPLALDIIKQDFSRFEIDTLANPVAITTKKKISVVHINELQEEDRIAERNINIAKSFKKKRTKIADRSEYAGTLNCRIYFKN